MLLPACLDAARTFRDFECSQEIFRSVMVAFPVRIAALFV